MEATEITGPLFNWLLMLRSCTGALYQHCTLVQRVCDTSRLSAKAMTPSCGRFCRGFRLIFVLKYCTVLAHQTSGCVWVGNYGRASDRNVTFKHKQNGGRSWEEEGRTREQRCAGSSLCHLDVNQTPVTCSRSPQVSRCSWFLRATKNRVSILPMTHFQPDWTEHSKDSFIKKRITREAATCQAAGMVRLNAHTIPFNV